MWSNLIGGIIFIILTMMLIVKFKRKNNRWKWIAGYIVCLIGIFYIFSYPLENLFYSFPSPEALAKYACDGKVIMIVDGSESSFIVYSKENNSYRYMISPKTESGYKIGRMLAHMETHQIASMQYDVSIISSKEVDDAYVLIGGLAEEKCVALQDNLNSAFILNETPESPIFEHEAMRILACAYLGDNFDVPYRVSTTDAKGTATAEFP